MLFRSLGTCCAYTHSTYPLFASGFSITSSADASASDEEATEPGRSARTERQKYASDSLQWELEQWVRERGGVPVAVFGLVGRREELEAAEGEEDVLAR